MGRTASRKSNKHSRAIADRRARALQLNHPQIEMVRVDALRVLSGNPRKHTKRQMEAAKTFISGFHHVPPVIADAEGNVFGGQLWLEAATALGHDARYRSSALRI